MKSYQLSEDAARNLAEIVRAYKAGKLGGNLAQVRRRPPGPYQPIWYRLLTDEGAGTYTARRQEWNFQTEAFQDVADEDHPEYGLDVTVYDHRGRDGAATDADGDPGDGLLVHGWRITADDEPVTLVDVCEDGPGEPVYLLGDPTDSWQVLLIATDEYGRCAGAYTYNYLAGAWAWQTPNPWGYDDPGLI
jgi:hypothetical protein